MYKCFHVDYIPISECRKVSEILEKRIHVELGYLNIMFCGLHQFTEAFLTCKEVTFFLDGFNWASLHVRFIDR